ncbi:MAG: hypothetical protein WA821_05985 [Anaerolineales bacterium]
MDKPKPFEAIAAKFGISDESAKYFLGQVQKSFKKEKPPQHMILDFMMIKKFKALPKPHEVATMMNEDGIWIYPLNAAPPVIEDEDDGYFSGKAPSAAPASSRPRPAPRRKLPPG